MRFDDQSAEFDAGDTTLVITPRGAQHQRDDCRCPSALGEVDAILAIAREAEAFRGDDGLNYVRVSHECGHATWAPASQDFAGTLREVRRLHCASDRVELSDSVDWPDRNIPPVARNLSDRWTSLIINETLLDRALDSPTHIHAERAFSASEERLFHA